MCYELGDISTEVPNCHATPLVSSCVDVVVVVSTSTDFTAHVSPDHVDILPASPLPSPPSPSLECHNLSGIDYHDALKGKCLIVLGP